jgi:hypothetical protein
VLRLPLVGERKCQTARYRPSEEESTISIASCPYEFLKNSKEWKVRKKLHNGTLRWRLANANLISERRVVHRRQGVTCDSSTRRFVSHP